MAINKCDWTKNYELDTKIKKYISAYDTDCGYNATTEDINRGFIFCPKCGREISKMDTNKEEIIYIVEKAFEDVEEKYGLDDCNAPNGTIWKYSDIIKYLKENLKEN
jgi:PHP family Zn ribbon phosphoesterase